MGEVIDFHFEKCKREFAGVNLVKEIMDFLYSSPPLTSPGVDIIERPGPTEPKVAVQHK